MNGFVNEARGGEDGTGPHILSYTYASAVAKPDNNKRSRIYTSQTVGAWIKSDQFKKMNTDIFQAVSALKPVNCIYRDYPCSFAPIKSNWVPNRIEAIEDIWRSK
jgi:hypothetical protein